MDSAFKTPLLYMIVIGFHHKKGCQIEFVHPLDERLQQVASDDPTNSSNDPVQFTQDDRTFKLPKKWRHLPSLALPDWSHLTATYAYYLSGVMKTAIRAIL